MTKEKINYSSKIIKIVKNLELPIGKYVVVGSSCLEIHGLRKADDIDILAFPELKELFVKKGFTQCNPNKPKSLLKDNLEAVFDWNFSCGYSRPVEEVVAEAEIFQDIPFAPLEEILSLKKTWRREKDIQDIILIENYLNKI